MKKLLFGSFLLFSSLCFFNLSAFDRNCCEKKCCSCPVICPEYGSWYTKDETVVAPGFAIPFDHESDHINHTNGIEHYPGDTNFDILEPGIYRVIYSVALDCEGDVALTLDGVVVQGSQMHIEKTEHLSTLALLINICKRGSCGCTSLNVINNNGPATLFHDNNIKLNSGKNFNVTAAILIEKAAECCCERDPSCECEDHCSNPCCDPCDSHR